MFHNYVKAIIYLLLYKLHDSTFKDSINEMFDEKICKQNYEKLAHIWEVKKQNFLKNYFIYI